MGSPLNSERWAKIENLFITAAGLSPEERESFVAAQCGADHDLREEVSSLLRYDTDGADIEEAVRQGAYSVLSGEPLENTVLWPWRVDRELGRGGMSVVYLAARSDGHFAKQVAIKVIKRGMDTAAVVERFRRERRILAALEHPLIARLLDGGTTADGLPWIAMEYVEGLPIDRWCEERRLSIEERCRLISKVCDAVSYAHRHLVIHRDLKPGNILVDETGNPKLLDFGIAKILDDREYPGNGADTRSTMRPLTPEYASPEQLAGGAVSTATDVYSLGAVLYELLTGTRPATNGSAGAEKASDAAARAGRSRRWTKRLANDLDNILEMALRPEPERRYSTIEQLQADLGRSLAGLPVAARPENLGYRLVRFVRRHPAGVAMSVGALLAAAVFAGVERDARIQRQKSEQRLGEVIALARTVMFEPQGTTGNLPGATQARLAIARKTTGYLDTLNRESAGDPRVLAALAAAYAQIARIEGNPNLPNLGDEPGAERNYLKAEALFAGLMARSGTSELRIQYADVRHELGELLESEGRPDKARGELRTALDQANTVLRTDAHNLRALKLVARIRLDMANAVRHEDPAGTRAALLDQLPFYEALLRDNPGDADVLQDLSSYWAMIGETLNLQGRLSDAAADFRKSAALSEELSALRPGDVAVQRDLMEAYGHLGDVTGNPGSFNMGDYNGAVDWFEKAAAIAEKLSAADPSDLLAMSDVGTAWARVAESQTAAGDYRAALDAFRRSDPPLLRALARAPDNRLVAQTLAFSDLSRARAFAATGDLSGEVESLDRVLNLCHAGLKKDAASASWNHMAWLAQGQKAALIATKGNRGEALSQAQQLLEAVRHSPIVNEVSKHNYMARALDANGAVHAILAKQASGDGVLSEWREAAGYYQRAMEEWNLSPSHTTEPSLSDFRRTQAGLAAALRESRGPVAR